MTPSPPFPPSPPTPPSSPCLPPSLKAVILAGGKGTRLSPYTTVLPKPLVPIGDRPILEIVITWLRGAGVREMIVSVGHLAELIRAFFGNGEKWGVHLEYVIEDQPLGTIGPLSLMPDLGEHFLVLNGDILTDLDLGALYRSHVDQGTILTVATYRREVNIDFGVLRYDASSRRIQAFEEKPTLSYDVSMGIYVLQRRCLEYVPRGRHFGFDDLVLTLLKNGEAVHSYPHAGRWLDIGRPEDYDHANQLFRNGISAPSEPPVG